MIFIDILVSILFLNQYKNWKYILCVSSFFDFCQQCREYSYFLVGEPHWRHFSGSDLQNVLSQTQESCHLYKVMFIFIIGHICLRWQIHRIFKMNLLRRVRIKKSVIEIILIMSSVHSNVKCKFNWMFELFAY